MKTAMQVPQVNEQSLWVSELKSMVLLIFIVFVVYRAYFRVLEGSRGKQ